MIDEPIWLSYLSEIYGCRCIEIHCICRYQKYVSLHIHVGAYMHINIYRYISKNNEPVYVVYYKFEKIKTGYRYIWVCIYIFQTSNSWRVLYMSSCILALIVPKSMGSSIISSYPTTYIHIEFVNFSYHHIIHSPCIIMD